MGRIVFIVMLVFIGSVGVADVAGPVRIIDGDTLDVGDVRLRLYGIDAPEMGQPCADSFGDIRDCGAWVRTQLIARYEGRQARCDQMDIDRYGRVVAICRVTGDDIGAALVSDGLALAFRKYSTSYDAHEQAAAAGGRGIWQFDMQDPAAFRASGDVSRACAIKGNIRGSQHIYHLPGQRYYARTRINAAAGERWFCTAVEAEAAGWRVAQS